MSEQSLMLAIDFRSDILICILGFFDSPKTVQVYIAVDAPKGFDAAFIKLCKDLSYKCEINKHIHVLRHDVPLIVVCPITSRLEPDIDHALNGLDCK